MPIQIRAAVPADAPALLAIYAPYVEQTAITFEYDVPAEAEFTRRIVYTLQNYPYLCGTAPEATGYWQTAPRCTGTGITATAFPQHERLRCLSHRGK